MARRVADLGLNAISIAVMALTGLVVGWRIDSSFGGFLVLLLLAYAISWLMAVVGLLVRTPEVVNNASFIVIFPLTFVASTLSRWRRSRRCCAPSPSGTRCRR